MRLAVLLVGLAPVALSGCVFGPVSLEGRACATDSDCITGYACSAALVCELVPDSGRPDAGHPDAPLPDVGSDAPLALDAPLDDDAGTDDAGTDDAGMDDAAIGDTGTGDAAIDDAGAADDAAAAADAP